MFDAREMDIFVDMCTQRDYLATDGACPSHNATLIHSNLKRLMALARWAKIPTLSCVDARRPEDVRGLPRPHCVIGTAGQRKLTFSVMPDHVLVESDNCLCISLDILKQHQQAILTKEHRDPFTNPKLDRLLTELPTRRFVVFGMLLESSIRLLTLGLMLRHRRVTLVNDACGWWDPEEGEMTMRQLAAKGCELTTTNALIESNLARYKTVRTNGQRRRSVA